MIRLHKKCAGYYFTTLNRIRYNVIRDSDGGGWTIFAKHDDRTYKIGWPRTLKQAREIISTHQKRRA